MGRLGLFIEEVSEKTTKNNQHEFLTSSQNGIVSQEKYFNKQIASIDNKGYKIIKKGQFTYRSMSDTGRFYIIRLADKEIGIVSPAYPVFKLVSDKIEPEYLELFFQSEFFQRQICDKTSGSTRLALRFSKMENVEIEVPSIEFQRKIIDYINALRVSINIENKNLFLYEELIKSRFNEMFGEINNTRFETKEIGNLCEFVKDGTHQTPTYTDDKINGFKFLSSKDVTSGKINWTNIKYIPKELHEKLYKTIKPQRNDILLAKNGTTGTAALVETDEIFDIYVSLAILRLKQGINPKFMLYAINNDDTKAQFKGRLKGVGVPNLHLGEIKKTKIIAPPIELQNEYVTFVQQIDKLKFNVQQRIEKYKELLNKKMDEYFN